MPPKPSPPAGMDYQPFMGVNMTELPQFEGIDHPDPMGLFAATGLLFLYDSIPAPPVSPAAPLAATAAASWSSAATDDDRADRISLLPDQILKDIISRLPAKSAARTGALASRWRGLWRSVPLALVDAHILPDSIAPVRMAPGGDDPSSRAVVFAASRALAAHPGPFRAVHLTWSHMASYRAEMARWLRILAAKGVDHLVFVNRPWPLDLPLPSAIFSCASLTRLHLGLWRIPDTAALPRAAGFPHLRELLLSTVVVEDQDMAFILDRSPVLEDLTIITIPNGVRLRIVSQSLRCLQVGMTAVEEIALVDTPRLERFFLWMTQCCRNKCSKIRIGNAPNLRMLGHWLPAEHQLEISNTIIEAGTKVSPGTIVPSVKIVALEVQFEVRNDVKMVPCFLKCFPNVETLHVFSLNAEKGRPTGKVNLKFWQEAGRIECVFSHVKKLAFSEFRGNKSELAFLKFVAERAQSLEKMVVMVASKCFSAVDDVNDKLKPLTSAKWASQDCKLFVMKSPSSDGATPPWSFRSASNFSSSDPFDGLTSDAALTYYCASSFEHS